jgi:tetratricopeptide (TPR) repeat protein
MMNFEEFIAHLRRGSFFDRIDRSGYDDRVDLLGWLRFVKTDAIEAWVCSGSDASISNRKNDEALMSLVLERRLVNLNTRRDPTRLRSFWNWLVEDDGPELVDLWNRHDPVSTMDDPCPLHQESAYGNLLQAASQELEQIEDLQWVKKLLKRLADERLPHRLLRPQVRVVFALDGTFERPESLRQAFVVNFRLLSPTNNLAQLCQSPEVFDQSFQEVFGRVSRRLDLAPRQLEHDAGFLDPGTLRGTSGTLALWLAQWLAARPRFDEDIYTTLPPWVVISSSLDHLTDKAVEVGGLEAKMKALAEEGVRYVIVGDEQQRDAVQPGNLPKLDICPTNPDLHGLRFNGLVGQLANELQHLKLLRKADVKDLQGTHLIATDPRKSARLQRLNEFRFVEFKIENDFISPAYAYKILQDKISSLSEGRGYLHLIGGAGMGKSTLVQSMRPGFKKPEEQPDTPTGPVIGHLVLRGTAENPSKFIEEILRDAERHAEATRDEGSRAKFMSKLAQLRVSIFQKQRPRPIQEGIADIIATVRKYTRIFTAVILAIDGLDELTMRDSDELTMRIHELLPLPERLDDGCYVLLTSRPELRKQVQQAVDQRKIDSALFTHCELNLNDPGYESIVREYIRRKLGSAAEPHIPVILEKAERRFIWVRLLVELMHLSRTDLSKTTPGELALPNIGQTLPRYMELLGSRVATIDENVVKWIKPSLLVIAAAFEPITRRHLHAWLSDLTPVWNEEAYFHLDAALIAIQPLLYENRVIYSEGSAYHVAHREIKDWLAENTEPGWFEGLRIEGHKRIGKVGLQMSFPKKIESKESVDHYHLLYLPMHLTADGEFQHALSLVIDSAWQAACDSWTEHCRYRMDYGESVYTETALINSIETLTMHFGGDETMISQRQKLADDLAGRLNNRGNARLFLQDFAGANTDYNQAIELREKLINDLGGEEAVISQQPNLADYFASSLMNRGSSRASQVQFAKAEMDYDRAVGLREKLILRLGGEDVVIEQQPELANNLSSTFSNRGLARAGQHNFSVAINDYNLAIGLREKLILTLGGEDVVIEQQPELANNLSSTFSNRGLARSGQHDFSEAINDYNLAIQLRRKLLGSFGDKAVVIKQQMQLAKDLARTIMNRGNARQCQRDFLGAVKDYREAIGFLEKLISTMGGEDLVVSQQPELADDLACTFMNCGNARSGRQDFVEAVKDYDRALELREKLMNRLGGERAISSQQPKFFKDVAGNFMNRGNALQGQQDFEGAVKDYDRALGFLEKLISMLGGEEAVISQKNELAIDLASNITNRGNALQCQQDFEGAVKDYDRAVSLLEKMKGGMGGEQDVVTKQIAIDLAHTLRNRGNARTRQRKFAQALLDYGQALMLLETLISELGGRDVVINKQPQLLNDLARTFMNYGDARARVPDYNGARNDYSQAISLLQKLICNSGGESEVIVRQPNLLNDLASLFMNRGLVRYGQKDFSGAVEDIGRTSALLTLLLPNQLIESLEKLLVCGSVSASIIQQTDPSGITALVKKAVIAMLIAFDLGGESICVPSVVQRAQWLLDWQNTPMRRSETVSPEQQPKWDELIRLLSSR